MLGETSAASAICSTVVASYPWSWKSRNACCWITARVLAFFLHGDPLNGARASGLLIPRFYSLRLSSRNRGAGLPGPVPCCHLPVVGREEEEGQHGIDDRDDAADQEHPAHPRDERGPHRLQERGGVELARRSHSREYALLHHAGHVVRQAGQDQASLVHGVEHGPEDGRANGTPTF